MAISAKGVVSVICRMLLTVIISMAAAVKLTDQLDKDVHKEMVVNFQKFGKVIPYDMIGFNADQFRVFVATLEIISVVLLWVVPLAGAFLLDATMVGAIYTHWAMGETDQLAPAATLGILASIVLILSVPSVEPVPSSTVAPEVEKKEQ